MPSLLSVEVTRAPMAIIGVGNALMHDDAFGPLMVRRLERVGLVRDRADVELVDAGTAGFDLMHHVLGREAVILLDAVAPREGECAGTVRVMTHDELLGMRRAGMRGSPHEPGIIAALQVAELAGALPQVTLVGVVPLDTSMGIGLSGPVRAAMDAAEDAVRGLLGNGAVIGALW
jgi:hydrogenase maturation protease